MVLFRPVALLAAFGRGITTDNGLSRQRTEQRRIEAVVDRHSGTQSRKNGRPGVAEIGRRGLFAGSELVFLQNPRKPVRQPATRSASDRHNANEKATNAKPGTHRKPADMTRAGIPAGSTGARDHGPESAAVVRVHAQENRYRTPRPRLWFPASLVMLVLSAAFLGGCSHLELDLYPIWRSGPVDNNGGWAWEAVGPLVYSRIASPDDASASRSDWGVLPLWSCRFDQETRQRELEVLWPVGRFLRTPQEWSDRILPIYWYWGAEGTRNDRSSLFLFPVFLRRTGPPGEGWALFPVYGRMQKFLGINEVSFVLFPLYTSTRRSRGQLHHVLWPIFAWGSGPRYQSLRFFPFFMHSTDEGDFDTQSYLWPLFSSGMDRGQTDRPRHFVHVWPFYGQWTREKAFGWTVLFPLFRGSIDHVRDEGELNLPWPFFQRWWHRDQQGWRLWPLYGSFTSTPTRAAKSYLKSQFVLWPLFWNREYGYLDEHHHETRVVPFFVYDRVANKFGEGSRWMLWPLAENEQQPDGSSKFVIGTLFPIRVWNNAAEERWSVLLSPYRQRRDASGRMTAHSILGLYRRYEAPGFTRWTIPLLYSHRRSSQGILDQYLLGTIRDEHDADGRRTLRVLGIPIPLTGGGDEAAPTRSVPEEGSSG